MALIGASNSLGGLAGSNALARLLVVISGDSSQLTSALAASEGKLSGFATNASSIGKALTRTITLPFLAIGGAAVKAATDFNFALTRVAALTPILDDSGKSFQELHDEILTLAEDPSVVAGPTDLANALYFAGSAGLDAADAMDVVKLSAQAQSVGMGDASEVAKVLIFAMNNYESEALSAADAMDALTVAIREGTAEPEDLAVALGRLLPVAQQAGVSFQEVVASVAALTNLGVPARVATTSLRALFSQLLAPTIAATTALDELGISAQQLRFALQQGPIEAFQLLTDATKGNFDQIRTLIPQIRGLTAFYGLSGEALEEYQGIIQGVTHSQGALQRVVEQFVNTPTFKFQKAVQQLQIAAIELGDKLIPVFVAIVGVIDDIARGFAALPGPAQAAFAALIALGAAIGPIFQLYGIITQLGTGGVASMKALATGIAVAGTAALAAAGSFSSLIQGSTNLISIAGTLIGTFLAVKLAIAGLQTALDTGKLGVGLLRDALLGLSAGAVTGIAAGIGILVTAIGLAAGAAERAEAELTQMREAFIQGGKSAQSFGETINNIKTEELRNRLAALAAEMDLLNTPTPQAAAAIVPVISQDLLSNLNQVVSDVGELEEVGHGAADELIGVTDAMNKAAASGGDLGSAFQAAGGYSGDFGDALDDLEALTSETDLRHLAGDTKLLAAELIGARDSVQAYNDAQIASIAAQQLSADAIDQLAAQYGVSTDFIKQALNETGQSAVFTSSEAQDAWAKLAFGVDKNGNLIDGSVKETAQAVADATDSMIESVSGAFNIFEKLPKDTTKSFDVYIERLQDVNTANAELVSNMANLAHRGVGSDLLQSILDAGGPDLIRRFANTTDKELNRYVRAFQVHMALGDAEVIKEGIHLQGKGKANITGFVKAVLSQRGLTKDAGQQIVQTLTTAFTAGNLRPAAFDLMIDFLNGVRSAKGITKEEASKISIAFSKQLLDSHNYNKDGSLVVNRVAEGISKSTGIPLAKVRELMSVLITTMHNRAEAAEAEGRRAASALARGVKNGQNLAFTAGNNLMQSLAAGIRQGTNTVVGAMLTAASKVNNAMDEGLHNSPEYASYYMGQKYARQFGEGFQSITPNVKIKDLGRVSHVTGRPRRTDQMNHRSRIRLDRRHVSDELSADDTYRGW